jgi:hypothetical protein
VMDKEILVLPVETPFDDFLRRPEHKDVLSHVVVTDYARDAGVLRINTALLRGLEDCYNGADSVEISRATKS